MTPAEKSAFRRLLADGVVLIRAWSGPANQGSAEQSQTALRHVNALAGLLHNLARCAADDFTGFDGALFWQQFRHLRQRIPELQDFEASYRSYVHQHPTA